MTKLTLELLPLELLGARYLQGGKVYFGIILPPTTHGESALKDYDIWVRAIHEEDQFLKTVKTIDAPLHSGSFSDAACDIYKAEHNGEEPESAIHAYSYLRSSASENLDVEVPYIKELLEYKPSNSWSNQPYFWYCILDLNQSIEKLGGELCCRRYEEGDLYVYRYWLRRIREEKRDSGAEIPVDEKYIIEREIDWIIDPFAREFGLGKLSAFTCSTELYEWNDENWKVPALKDLIMYEMMLDEFNEDIDGALEKLEYLKDLGINCISLMPITNVDGVVDWGYTPIGYFGIDERFGRSTRRKFKEFMDKAHANNIAVTFDAVYAHTSPLFCYYALYEQIYISDLIAKEQETCKHLPTKERDRCERLIKEKYRDSNQRYDVYDKQNFPGNPFMGRFSRYDFSKSVDFNKKFTQDFFFTVSYYWLDEFHFDGFRYDYVPGFYFPKNISSIPWADVQEEVRQQIQLNPGIEKKGFKLLVQEIFNLVKEALENKGYAIPIDRVERFIHNNTELEKLVETDIHLIQSAENLDESAETLRETAANCTWQNGTLRAAEQVARQDPNYMKSLGFQLGLSFENIPSHKTQLQYIENHDNQRFVCNFGFIPDQGDPRFEVFREGNRNVYGYKVQPYLMALFTAKGIPLLWQGQEFCENNYVPPDGGAKGCGRIRMFRPIRWDFFYDDLGQAIISLIRKLTQIRSNGEQFRSLDPTTYYFHNHQDLYQKKGILVYYRFIACNGLPEKPFSIIMLNFTDEAQTIHFRFPRDPDGAVFFPKNYEEHFIDEFAREQYLLDERYALSKGVKLDATPPKPEKFYDGKEITIGSNYGCIWTADESKWSNNLQGT